jgi:hypothetical protein
MRVPHVRGDSRLRRIILAGVDFPLEVNPRTKKLTDWSRLRKKLRQQAPNLAKIAALMFQHARNDDWSETFAKETSISPDSETMIPPTAVDELPMRETIFTETRCGDESAGFFDSDSIWWDDSENKRWKSWEFD